LFGVSVLNAVVMLANPEPLAQAAAGRSAHGGHQQCPRACASGADHRHGGRAGLVPAALAHGLGSDVQRPLATVVVGGLVTPPC
jgi:cobalt-zinc-cadmium resistance protein CzcA